MPLSYFYMLHFYPSKAQTLILLLRYPIQKVTEIYKKFTKPYNFVTELENSSWNIEHSMSAPVRSVPRNRTYPTLKTFLRF